MIENLQKHVVLVEGCHTYGHLGVIRSLGRAGLKVLASSPDKAALGFFSRYSDVCLISPAYEKHIQIQSWLRETIKSYKVDLIIPTEGLLLALNGVYGEFSELFALPSNHDQVYAGYSKYALFSSYAEDNCRKELICNLPNFITVAENNDFPKTNDFNHRCYVKVDEVNAKKPGCRDQVIICDNPKELPALVNDLTRQYRGVVVQEHHNGVGTGVFFVRWDGRIVASFMYRGIHEVPHTGGTSSLRVSWWHEKQYEDALKRVEAMDWQGVIMFEYRWDERTDEFALIEVNARFWMSVHVALYAGSDIPLDLANSALGLPIRRNTTSQPPYWKQGVKSQLTFPLEVGHVWSYLKDIDISLINKLKALFALAFRIADPRIKSDLAFPGDRMVFFYALRKYARDLLNDRELDNLLSRAWRKIKRSVYYDKELLVYRIESSAIQKDDNPLMEIDSKEHFEGFDETERWFKKADVIQEAGERMERGEQCYSYMENGLLLHFGWLVPRQKKAFLSDVGMEFGFPKNTSVLYNFYTHPNARGRGLYYKNLMQMLNDCRNELESDYVYISVLRDNAASRHVIRKAGFQLVAQLHEKTVLGFKKRWSELVMR